MADSCRVAISNWWNQDEKTCSNAGLLRDRYLQVAVKDKAKHPAARKALFEAMQKSLVESKPLYTSAYHKWQSSQPTCRSDGFFKTTGRRMIIGLGGENVLETGITLHHTYGTPIIPGTSLKGLASHYCDIVWGAVDPGYRRWKKGEPGGEHHKAIFGTTDDSGHIIFHDAWITPETLLGSLQLDVMTPHHGDYYSDKTGSVAPTDFDDPNPVTFLSVVGTFHISVSCDVLGDDGKKWADLVFGMLENALKEWGVGGKTNSGYGSLTSKSIEDLTPLNDGLKRTSAATTQQLKTSNTTVINKPKHNKGEVIEVTKEPDPNVRRGKPYFKADDGFGGFVNYGYPPEIQLGAKTRLEVAGVMDEGYVFAVVGSKNDSPRKKQAQKRRR